MPLLLIFHIVIASIALLGGRPPLSVTPRLNRLAGHPFHSDALLVAPTLLVLLFMIFWLGRVLASNAYTARGPAPSARTSND